MYEAFGIIEGMAEHFSPDDLKEQLRIQQQQFARMTHPAPELTPTQKDIERLEKTSGIADKELLVGLVAVARNEVAAFRATHEGELPSMTQLGRLILKRNNNQQEPSGAESQAAQAINLLHDPATKSYRLTVPELLRTDLEYHRAIDRAKTYLNDADEPASRLDTSV